MPHARRFRSDRSSERSVRHEERLWKWLEAPGWSRPVKLDRVEVAGVSVCCPDLLSVGTNFL